MPNTRCEVCESEYVRQVIKKSGNKNTYIDMNRMVSRCRIPKFTHDLYGHPVVIYWDCRMKREVTYSQKEFERKRVLGEL